MLDSATPLTGVEVWPEVGRFKAPGANLEVSYHHGLFSRIGAGGYDRRQIGVVEPHGPAAGHAGAWRRAAGPPARRACGASDPPARSSSPTASRARRVADIAAEDLAIRADDEKRAVIRLERGDGPWTFTGAGSLRLEGLLFSGEDIVLAGDFEHVILSCCTLDPGNAGEQSVDGRDLDPTTLFIDGTVQRLTIDRCITGPIATRGIVEEVCASDSILGAVTLDTGVLSLDRCTVLGALDVHRLECSESILDDVAVVAERSGRCVRFSAWASGSLLPRKYECVRVVAARAAVRHPPLRRGPLRATRRGRGRRHPRRQHGGAAEHPRREPRRLGDGRLLPRRGGREGTLAADQAQGVPAGGSHAGPRPHAATGCRGGDHEREAMAIDLARASFDRARHYTGVAPQQGRVSLEAEENEAREILATASRAELREIVGPAGTPDDGYALTGVGGYDFNVGAGTMYVGGNRVQLDEDVLYSDQPEWLNPTATPSTPTPASPRSTSTCCSCCASTTSPRPRTGRCARSRSAARTARRARGSCSGSSGWRPNGKDCPTALAEDVKQWNEQGLTFDPATMELRSKSRLLVSFDAAAEPDDPCEPASTGGYLGAENQVIRVQVTAVHEDGTFDLLWGWDNASFLYRVTADESTPPVLTLDRQPVDGHHRPRAGQAVELLQAAAELRAVDGEVEGTVAERAGLAGVLAAPYDPDTKSLPFPVAIPPAWTDGEGLYLRVWEELLTGCKLDDAVVLTGTGLVVTVSAAVRAGDHWSIAARPETPTAVLPAALLRAPRPPDGPRTWVAPLAVIAWENREFRLLDDCRRPFLPLVDILPEGGGCCTVSVRPSQAGSLQKILNALAKGRDPHDRNDRVTLCLKPGRYELPRTLVLDQRHGHVHIEGCGEGVTLAAAKGREKEFAQGLIALVHADNVRISGIEFELPLTPAAAGGVKPPTTGAAFANLYVSVGLRPVHSAQLEVDRCLFRFRVGPSETTPSDEQAGPPNVFAVGIFAGSECWGMTVERCRFLHDVTRGPVAGEGPMRILLGLLLAPTIITKSTRSGTLVRSLLDDAVIRDNRFAGLSLGGAIFADLGDIRIQDNALSGGYGGFWIFSLESGAFIDTASRFAIGNVEKDTVRAVRDTLMAGSVDPVLLAVSLIGRTYPLPTELQEWVVKPRQLLSAGARKEAQKAFTRRLVTDAFAGFVASEGKGHTFEVGDGRVYRAPLGLAADAPALRKAHAELAAAEVALAEPTRRDRLRLRCTGNDLDCALEDNAPTSAALIVWAGPITGGDNENEPPPTVSALVADNRMSATFGSATAMLIRIGRAVATGNHIENLEGRGSFSLAVLAPGDSVAATGNFFKAMPVLPARPLAAPFNTWIPFNAIEL